MTSSQSNDALVLFSGGQDSSIALAYALEKFDVVRTVGFRYGQRHEVELKARSEIRNQFASLQPDWKARLSFDHLIDLGNLENISPSALTSDGEIKQLENGLPSTFVPGRNLIFLVYAGVLAYKYKASKLVAGMCEVDFSGYPDCREETMLAQMQALQLGMDVEMSLETPLMHLTKAASWHLAEEIGGKSLVRIINNHSHTCYLGDRSVKNDWGYGCGSCPACELRSNGWSEYIAQRVDR